METRLKRETRRMGSETNNNRNEDPAIVMALRDSLSPSPGMRAFAVYNILNQRKNKPTLWDLICFSIETISASVVDYPFLTAMIKALNRQIYAIHYYSTEPFDSFIDIAGKEKE